MTSSNFFGFPEFYFRFRGVQAEHNAMRIAPGNLLRTYRRRYSPLGGFMVPSPPPRRPPKRWEPGAAMVGWWVGTIRTYLPTLSLSLPYSRNSCGAKNLSSNQRVMRREKIFCTDSYSVGKVTGEIPTRKKTSQKLMTFAAK